MLITIINKSNKTITCFSWHEMGIYDLSAEIDLVLKKTGRQSLSYVGHSMGTTMMFVLLSVRPEFNEKIRVFVCLSPVAYLGNVKSDLFRLLTGPFAVKKYNKISFHLIYLVEYNSIPS